MPTKIFPLKSESSNIYFTENDYLLKDQSTNFKECALKNSSKSDDSISTGLSSSHSKISNSAVKTVMVMKKHKNEILCESKDCDELDKSNDLFDLSLQSKPLLSSSTSNIKCNFELESHNQNEPYSNISRNKGRSLNSDKSCSIYIEWNPDHVHNEMYGNIHNINANAKAASRRFRS